MCATFAPMVCLWSLLLGGIPSREHYPLFLWCTQPHPCLLQFLSTSGRIIKNNIFSAKKRLECMQNFSTYSLGWDYLHPWILNLIDFLPSTTSWKRLSSFVSVKLLENITNCWNRHLKIFGNCPVAFGIVMIFDNSISYALRRLSCLCHCEKGNLKQSAPFYRVKPSF